MTLDWIDIAILLASSLAAAALLRRVWLARERRMAAEVAALEGELERSKDDPQPAMLAFLASATATLKQQAEELHRSLTGLELEIARKRKRLSDVEKRPDRKDGEVACQQEALARMNRRLIEYQAAMRRMQQQQARTALIHKRIESGALDPGRVPTFRAEADGVVDAVKAEGHSHLRHALLNPEHKAAAAERARPATLSEWRMKLAETQRAGPNVKRRLAK